MDSLPRQSHRYVLFGFLTLVCVALSPSLVTADSLTVTTTDDAGPGSLRQAIIDANAMGGAQDIVFDIPNTDSRFNDTFWNIILASELPALTDSGTRILGFSQAATNGDTNPGQVGTGGTVGVDQMQLPMYDKPEIQIAAGGFNGLTIAGTASDILIEGIAIVNAAHGIVGNGLSAVGTAGKNRMIQSVFVGVFADGSDPTTLRNTGHGIVLEPSAAGLPGVELDAVASYVGYNGNVGIVGIGGSTTIRVSYCEVFNNGLLSDEHDGIDLNGVSSVARYNLSRDNTNMSQVVNGRSGHGIEAGSQDPGTGGHIIENNTVLNNLDAGIGIRNGSSENLVQKNIASGNAAGISVNIELSGQTDGNQITENSTYDNSGLGIDLHADESGEAFDGVTLNSPTSGASGSNLLVPYPVITEAEMNGDTLTFSGFSEPGGEIEVFEADTDPTGFGEGRRFLFRVAEGSDEDLDDTTGPYGPVGNGVVISTEELVTNRFEFHVLVEGVEDSLFITATQTTQTGTVATGKNVSLNTSEFGPTIAVESGGTGVATELDELPGDFRLLGAYPNPFNPSTTIEFELERPGIATLHVFSVTGSEVARLVDSHFPAGLHKVAWDAGNLPSGTYFYRLAVDGKPLAGSVVLLK